MSELSSKILLIWALVKSISIMPYFNLQIFTGAEIFLQYKESLQEFQRTLCLTFLHLVSGIKLNQKTWVGKEGIQVSLPLLAIQQSTRPVHMEDRALNCLNCTCLSLKKMT